MMPDGSLLVVSMNDKRVLRQVNGQLQPHADLSAVAGGPCNDMVVDRIGRAYVGNFGFDLDAAITGGDPYKTTLQAWKYTMPAFLVPFMFVLDDAGRGLLLIQTLLDRPRCFVRRTAIHSALVLCNSGASSGPAARG